MNWEMLAAIGEILGSAAVLVTLVYLTIQARQNAASIQASTRQAILQEDQQFLFRVMDDPELGLLRFKSELTDEEKIRLSVYLIAFFRMRENLWRQYQNGVLDKGTWESYLNSLKAFASARVRTWVNNDAIADMLDPEFVSLVREFYANTPERERPIWIDVFD
jgi:hypothetical protein